MSKRLKPYYSILLATNGIEALSIINSNHIDLLFTDVMMPGMDGFELIAQLRQNDYKEPIIILTSKLTFSDKKKGFSMGTDDYMIKPVNYDELHWRINALLRRAHIANEKKFKSEKLS
ncbi:MAG: response regulator transcription factor [Lachnotalea sp.]